jgi:hypothetical protein
MSIYTYNGAEFSEEDVIAKAKEKGMDLDSYIDKFGIERVSDGGPGKKKPVVVGDATVAGTKNMASKSAKPSSASQDNPFGKVTVFDPLNITKNSLAAATQASKRSANKTIQGTKLDSRGYAVPKNAKEPTLWDDAVAFAKNLFIDKDPDENGRLTYYDQTPIKDQQASFKQNSQEALTATGKFEFLKDYSVEDRALFVSKLVPKTSYTEKKYNRETNDYDIVPKQEAVDYITKDIDPSKFKTKAQLDKAISLNVKKLASEDSSFEFEQKLAKAKAAPLIQKKIEDIKKKYSLKDAESVSKATKELQNYAATITTDFLVNSSGFQHLNQTFSGLESEATSMLTKQFERDKIPGFKLVDTAKEIGKSVRKIPGAGLVGLGIEGAAELGEMGAKGAIGLANSYEQSLVSTNHGAIKNLNEIYKNIKSKSDSEKIDKQFGYEWKNNELSTFDPSEQDIPATYGEAKNRLKKYLDKTNSLIGERVQKIADTKEYLGLFNEADLKDGISLRDVTRLVGEQAPNLAITAIGSASGNPLLIGLGAASMFTQTYGTQYYDTIETGLKEKLNRQPTKEEIVEAIGSGKYADRAEAAAGAAISAGLEFASELNIIKNTGKALGFGNDAKTVLGSLLRGEVKNFGKSMLNNAGNIAKSSLGEYLTESIQQGIDQATKGLQLNNDASKYIDLKEINEAGKAGGLIGAVFPFAGTIKTQTGIELRAAAVKVASSFDLSNKNLANLTQVDNFFKAASENIEERFKIGDLNTDQRQAELETLGTIRSSGVKIPSDFSGEAKEKALGLMLEKANIEKSIDGKDKDLVTPETERLKNISAELAGLAFSEKERIRIGENKETLDTSIESINKIVDKNGDKIYQDGLGNGKSIEVFETGKDAQIAYNKWFANDIKKTKADLQNRLDNKAISQEEFNSLNKELDNASPEDILSTDGFVLKNGQILINKEQAARVGALNVAPHELLHNILKSEFSNSKRKIELKDKFLSVLSKSERKKLDNRILAVDNDGNRLYSDQDLEDAPDEYMTQYFELLADGTIGWSDNVKETLIRLWDSVIKPIFVKQGLKNIEFEDGRDIYNFIKDYSKSIKKGKISDRAQGLLEAGENISGVTKKSITRVKEVEQKIEKLEAQFEKDEIEYDDYTSRLEAFEKELEKAKAMPEVESKPKVEKQKAEITEEDEVKEIIKEGKASIASDKVQKIYDEKGVNGAPEIIDLFKPITKKIINKRRDAPGFEEDLFRDELESSEQGILGLIMKYNPSKGIPLAAYINKYLPVRAIAVSRKILDKEFSKDVTEEKGLMAEETVSEVSEKPKYKNALESKVISPDVLETIYNKIITVVRTLKTRIDAPISLNRTVTPLISEIKDNIGKQLDIDIKTMLGGKKDGVLKKELLRNKRYILENMTTTWLMGLDGKGGIPQAIQKQIDGKWVNYPDWVGQKIDRESVSTDNAGRTSGAEIVRRIPNVFNNVSDADFLGQIIGPDGNPIRGRKESLSKAMAEEIAFDIINDDFANEGPIFEAFKVNQERLGVEMIETASTEIARQIERGNIKRSLTNDQFRNAAADLFHAASDFGVNSKEVNNILNKLPLDDANKLKEYVFEEYIDFLIKFQNIKSKARGTVYEKMILKELNKLKLKGVKIVTKKAKGYDSTGEGDINIQLEKGPLNIEVKLNALAQMGSASLNIDLNDNNFTFSKELDLPKEFVDKLKGNISNFKEYKKAAESIGVNTKSWPYKMTKAQHEFLRDNGFQKALTVSANTDQSIIEQLYNSKNVYYINIGNQGLFALGEDILGLGVPLLKSKVKLTARLVRGGEYNRIRLFPTLVDFKEKSKYNVDNAASNNAMFTKYKANSLKASRSISPEFNKIIEENKGVESYKNFSDIVARRRGIGKNKFDVYVPSSAADFELLLYNFMGKGAKGEEQKKFFTDTLLKPYANGNDLMDAARQSIKREYKQLLNEFPDVAKMIEKKTPDGDFTYDQAIRVAMWNEEGVDIPGLSQRDSNKLTTLVNSDPELKAFKDALIVTGRQGRGWIKPEEYWDANTIISDLHNLTEGEGRKKFLSEFIANAEDMFGKFENGKLVGPNINKVEAVYGTDVREALEDVLYRMITGKNKSFGKDKETSNWAKWVSGSTGAIMFLNVRSAALQLIGAVNFLNLRDNNPYAAAKAFANQKQYWEDFATIWNSDKMKERRGGLKEDVAAAEIANAAAGSKNKVGAVLSYLLKIGYTPTQMADSFAIASGGAPFYRNRIKSYLKEGMTEQEAEEAAWDDFTKVSDETQQSGDPRDISKQQASPAGRLLLTFQNTAMQQSRIVKKAVLDLKNGRGDAKTNFAKIAYYVAIQNTMFAVLQQGLFAVAFGDDDEDEEKPEQEKKLNEKLFDVADGVIDTVLRGTGFAGGIVATVKNMAKKYLDERDKKFKADYAKVVLEGANLSPPIGSKLRKLYSGLQQTKFDKDLIEKRGWDVMQDGRVKLSPSYGVTGKVVEAFTNVPMDRLVTKVNNASEALNSQNTTMQRIMVGLGWSPYSAGIEDSAGDKKIREEAKAKRKVEGVEKAKETRERTKDSIRQLPVSEQLRLRKEMALDRREKRRRRKMG